MKIKKGVLIGSIICFVFAFIYLCIGLVANNHIFANEENTTELSGTVVMVEEDDDGYLGLLEGEVVPSISVCAVLLVIAAVLLVIYIRRLKRSKDIR